MNNEYHKNIISEEKMLRIIINEIYIYNLKKYVNKIIIDNSVPFARYYANQRKLCFNYNSIIFHLINKSNMFIFDNTNQLFEYINLNILSIIFHEIKHIEQEKKKNELILLCEMNEMNLKSKQKYDNFLYLVNPIERQAQIYSLYIIFYKNYHMTEIVSKIFKSELLKTIKYGYSNSKYPILTFFEDSIFQDQAIQYSEKKITDFDKKLEYGCRLNIEETKFIKEMAL